MRPNSDSGHVPLLRTIRLVPSRTAVPMSEPRRRTSSTSQSTQGAPIKQRERPGMQRRGVVTRPVVTDRQARRANMTALYEGKERYVHTAPPSKAPSPPATQSMLSMNVVRESLGGYDPSFAALPWEQPSWAPPQRAPITHPYTQGAPPPLTPLSQQQRQTLNELAEVDRRLEMLCGGSPSHVSVPIERQATSVSHPRHPMATTTPRPWCVQGHLSKQVFDTAAPMQVPPPPMDYATPKPTPRGNTPSVPPLDLALLQEET
jgi:hypothetical protein